MLLGYAQSARRPPALPEAPAAIEEDSRIVILWSSGLNEG